jgi:trigger factor
MQVTETTNEGLKRGYKIVVPAGDIEKKLSDRLTEVARTARLPGFRPGKVPVSLLRKNYGTALRGEILEATVNEATQQAMTDKDLRPVGQPKVEIEKFDEGGDLEYKVELEVFPEIKLTNLADIKLERVKVKPDESQVDRFLQQMADGQKGSDPVTDDRPVASGDVAVIDFVGSVDGVEFPGGKADNYSLEIGSGSFIPGFEDQIVGQKMGEVRDIKVTFPEDYVESLKGKDAVFKVTMKEIRKSVPVEINDELAKKMGIDNLEELKKTLRGGQEREFAQHARARLKRELLDVLDKTHSFELPQGMVDMEFDAIWQQIQHAKEHHPEQLDADDKNKSDDELKAQYREIAERRVRLGLLLADIARINDIKVTAEEISRAVMAEAQKYRGQEKQVLDYYRSNPQAAAALQSPILEDKVVDFILEIAQISDKEMSVDELMELERSEAPARDVPEFDHDHHHDHDHDHGHDHDHDHDHAHAHDHDHDHAAEEATPKKKAAPRKKKAAKSEE